MRHVFTLALVGALVLGSMAQAPAQTPPNLNPPPAPNMTLQMIPKSIVNGHEADLLIVIESTASLGDTTLQVFVAPGLEATPSCLTMPAFSGKVIQRTVIRRTKEKLLAGEHPVIVELAGHPTAGPGGSAGPCAAAKNKILASQSLAFEYHPEIDLLDYLILGMIGVLGGWFLRFGVNLLKSVPPPLPAALPQAKAAPTPAPSFMERLTDWVKRYYYVLDCLVTLGIALTVLVFMAKSGRPPESGALWPGALATGIGLGLLTNSELLTRLR